MIEAEKEHSRRGHDPRGTTFVGGLAKRGISDLDTVRRSTIRAP